MFDPGTTAGGRRYQVHRDPLDAGKYVRSSVRMGGNVKRYHTWPTIQSQTVMDHTGNVMRIYLQTFRELPESIAVYLLFHDLSEVDTGDPPHPLKAHNPVLKAEYDRLEDQALCAMVGDAMAERILSGWSDELTDTRRKRMKAADLLEMWEFAMTEQMLGSHMAEPIIDNIRRALDDLSLDEQDEIAVNSYIDREIMRFHR